MTQSKESIPVLVAGAGPVGLWTARELALAGVPVRIVERDTARSPYIRAFGLQPRTIELMDMRGILDELMTERAVRLPVANAAGLLPWLDLTALDTAHPFGLAVRQNVVEQAIETSLAKFDVLVERGAEVTDVAQDGEAVHVTLAGGRTISCQYLVGCDGAHSVVRKAAGIGFPGHDSTATYILADVDLADPPDWLRKLGIMSYPGPDGRRLGWIMGGYVPDTGTYRLMMCDEPSSAVARHEPVTFEEVRRILTRLAGSDFGVHTPTWLSRVGNVSRVADRYRAGRVLVAGDAAHVHSPFGGQGLNTGVQDAMNLGWKLAAVVHGTAGDELLDTYHDERHPVGQSVVANTMAQTSMVFDWSPSGQHMRDLFSRLLALPQVNRYLAGMVSAVDVAYPAGDSDDPLVGTRVPDMKLDAAPVTQLYELFRDGRHVLLSLGDGEGAGAAQTPAGPVAAVGARLAEPRDGWDDIAEVLIRPDGYVARVTRA